MSRLTKAWRNTQFYRRRASTRLPQVLIIGAQKGGTSALFNYLAQHPRFAPAKEKEVDFFGSDLRYSLGAEWYAAQWDCGTPGRAIRFEGSPQYLYAPQAPSRIRNCVPQVKLIAVLRDPVLRAHSAWQMYRQLLTDDPLFFERYYSERYSDAEVSRLVRRTPAELEDFWLAIQREAACLERGRSMQLGILELGFYGLQLKRYLDLFPREQILVLDSNDLRNRRVHTLDRVLRFVGLPNWDWSRADLQDVFVGKCSAPIPERAQDFLREYYRASNRLLAEMLDAPPLFARDDVRRLASA